MIFSRAKKLPPLLSLVIPAHNEEKRIHLALRGFGAELKRRAGEELNGKRAEILVVSDGSTDGTKGRSEELFREQGIEGRVIELSPCRGKGGAIAEGFRAAEGEFLFFSDADLSTPADTLWPMLRALSEGADVVIGTRRVVGARVVEHQGKIRETLGQCFTLITNTMLGTNQTDFTCGFKGYRAAAARAIYERLYIPGWAFDAEALFLAHRLGFRVVEIPVEWADVEGSKVNAGAEVFRCLRDLTRIRARNFAGGYGLPDRSSR